MKLAGIQVRSFTHNDPDYGSQSWKRISRELEAFYAAGYEEQQVLEIILGLSSKQLVIMLSYLQIHQLTLVFKKFAWSKKISKFYATLF
jgi:glutamate synthase domain-containing protein 1